MPLSSPITSSLGTPYFGGGFHRRIWGERRNPFRWEGELSGVDKSLSHGENNQQSVDKFIA